MSLTNAEKVNIRTKLGFSSAYIDTLAESRMATLSTDEETLVRSVLTDLATVDAKLMSLNSGASAGVKIVDEIEFFETSQQRLAVASQGRMLVNRLSIILGVFPLADYYSSQIGPRSGLLPLG